MAMTVTMTCPNEDCQSDFDADVTCVQPAERATRDDPGCPAEYEASTPGACHVCGCDLDTAEVASDAIDRALRIAADDALEG